MKNIILYSILVLTNIDLMAQAMEPKAPFPETPFSVDVKDKLTGEDLGRGNWAFEINISNENSKPLHCLNTTFLAYLDDYSKHCPKGNFGDYGIYLNVSENGKDTLDIPANSNINLHLKGYDERVAKEKATGLSLEFCGRDAWDLKCGFNCPDGRVYEEKWDETIPGGARKRKCESNGTAVTIPGTFSCNPGFDRDDTNEKCIPKLCDNRYAVGSQVSFNLFDGARDNATSGSYKAECLTSGFFGNPIPGTFSCTIDYYLNADGSACLHKSTRPSWSLGNNIGGCTDPGLANTQACRTGTVRWCTNNGYGGSGFAQEYGSTGFAALCFVPDHIDLINRSDLPFFKDQDTTSGYFRVALVKYCMDRYGLGFGLVHEVGANGALAISCSKSEIFVIDNLTRDDRNMKSLNAQFSTEGCLGLASDLMSPGCHALAHRYCASKGFSGGYISGQYGKFESDIQCINGGYFKGIDY